MGDDWMIDTAKYEGHTSDWRWVDINEQDNFYLHSEYGDIINHDTPDGKLAQDAPLLLEFIQKVVEEWGKPNQCNQAFGKDVRHLMLLYGLINYNEDTRRYYLPNKEVKE